MAPSRTSAKRHGAPQTAPLPAAGATGGGGVTVTAMLLLVASGLLTAWCLWAIGTGRFGFVAETFVCFLGAVAALPLILTLLGHSPVDTSSDAGTQLRSTITQLQELSELPERLAHELDTALSGF